MIRNFLKTAFRSLLKNRRFTILNVMGLALGIATVLLIVAYVYDEWSYDRFNLHADRIYRVDNEIRFGGNEKSYAIAPAPVARAFRNDFPEVEETARLLQQTGFQVSKGHQHIQEDKMAYADSSLFRVFTLPLLSGDPSTALKDPKSIVITEAAARKYFNSTNALGKTLTLNDTSFYKVTGIMKNIPGQSHFDFDFLLSMSTLAESREDAWLVPAFNTYVLLQKGAKAAALSARLPAFMQQHAGPQLQGMLNMSFEDFEKAGNSMKLSLTPLTDIHLRSDKLSELGPNGNILYVYIFSLVAGFVLLIACMNFMNLSTARSSNRAREVGVRKVLGSPRKYLIFQFLTESVLVTLISVVAGVIIAFMLLPVFNDLSGKQLTLTPQLTMLFLPGLLAGTLLIGCMAGAYPAFFLSAFQPIAVLKGKLASGFKDSKLRNVLVVSQFTVSIMLIIGTLVIYRQLQFIQHKDLGYNRNHILTIQNVSLLGSQAAAFKKEVKQLSGITEATLTGYLPTRSNDNIIPLSKIPQLDPTAAVKSQVWEVDEDYIPTLGISMASGRNFSNQYLSDSNKIILNEAAAKLMGLSNPLNGKLYEPQDDMGKNMKEFRIIGVMKNFNFKSLRENVAPMIFLLGNDHRALSVQINRTAVIPALLAKIENTWKKLAPDQPFSYSFMEQDFDALYRTEQRMGLVFMAFASLAIIIACLGLFGLAAYAVEQRSKEIGIRKILGANVSGIVKLLSKDFIRLVCLSLLIAIPFAGWGMQKWLQGFAYRESIQWWIFALAGGIAILIAFVTISSQALRAALSNPVDSLKDE